MKRIIILIFLFINLQAKDNIYFLPQNGKEAEQRMINLFYHAHQNIKIAIFTFTNKKFLKAIKSAARRGVEVKIVADYENNKNQKHWSIIPQLKKLRNVKVKLLRGIGKGKYKGIMHIKMFIIDDSVIGFGSANYTKSAFYKNYELLYINDDWTFTRKFVKIFDKLWSK